MSKKLNPCKCGSTLIDRDLGFDPEGRCYEEIECLECRRRVVMLADDEPAAAEIWNVVMLKVEMKDAVE